MLWNVAPSHRGMDARVVAVWCASAEAARQPRKQRSAKKHEEGKPGRPGSKNRDKTGDADAKRTDSTDPRKATRADSVHAAAEHIVTDGHFSNNNTTTKWYDNNVGCCYSNRGRFRPATLPLRRSPAGIGTSKQWGQAGLSPHSTEHPSAKPPATKTGANRRVIGCRCRTLGLRPTGMWPRLSEPNLQTTVAWERVILFSSDLRPGLRMHHPDFYGRRFQIEFQLPRRQTVVLGSERFYEYSAKQP